MTIQMPEGDEWFHRGPCHLCGICGSDECYVWNNDVASAVHFCVTGCDGPGPS